MKSRNPYVVSRNSEDTRATLQHLASTGEWRRASSPLLQTFSNMTGINAVLWIWMDKGFWRGRLKKDEDLPRASWCLEQVFARLGTCMTSWTATDLLHALGQISLTFKVLIFTQRNDGLFYLVKITMKHLHVVNTHITAIMQAYKQKHGVKLCLFGLVNNSKVFAFPISYPNQPLQNQSFAEKTTELAKFPIKGDVMILAATITLSSCPSTITSSFQL